MQRQRDDIVIVPAVKPLRVCLSLMQRSYTGHVVNDFPRRCVEQIVTTIIVTAITVNEFETKTFVVIVVVVVVVVVIGQGISRELLLLLLLFF